MNGFGVFLYCLRREKRITQAELAEKLGVSNKAVSKWETGDAMPETSLLVPISKIFNVTVDELLNGARAEVEVKNSTTNESALIEEEKLEKTKFNGHILFNDKENKKRDTLSDILSGIVCTIVILLGAVTYIIIGLTTGLWDPYWVIMPCCGIICGIVGIIFGLCNSKKREEDFANGENPYTGAICGIIMLTCVIIYLPLGAFLNLWHPCWMIPAVGGFLCAVVGAIGNISLYRARLKDENKTKQ